MKVEIIAHGPGIHRLLKWDGIILMRLIWPGALAHELGITEVKFKCRGCRLQNCLFTRFLHILSRCPHIFAPTVT